MQANADQSCSLCMTMQQGIPNGSSAAYANMHALSSTFQLMAMFADAVKEYVHDAHLEAQHTVQSQQADIQR